MDQTEFVKSIKSAIGIPSDMDDEAALAYALFYINEGKKKVLGGTETDTRGGITEIINPSNAALVLAVAKMIIDLAMQITKEDDTKEKEKPDGEETILSPDRRSDT